MPTTKEVLTFAIDAGKLMLENGAETYRVEDTMLRIMNSYNLKDAEAFVTTTGVFVCVSSQTLIRRIKERTINLNKIAKVNALSRKITSNSINFNEAKKELKEIEQLLAYPFYLKTLVTGIGTSSFCYIFGGGFYDCINAFFVGIILNIVLYLLKQKSVSNFLTTMLGGSIVALLSLIFYKVGLGNNVDNSIIGSLMPLVPGVGLTNAIRDILEGDFISGSGRIFDAVIVGVALATGVGTVMGVWIRIFEGL